jgi:hypothetical protein
LSKSALTAFVVALILACVLVPASAFAEDSENSRTLEQIIESYVQDFRSDRFADTPRLFGIEVPQKGQWHVRVTGQKTGETWGVELHTGPAPEPTYVYRVEEATLRMVDSGELNSLTARGKMFATDYAPMDVIGMDGWDPSPEEYAAINPFSFHFWTRGFPEVIPFGQGLTRKLHGSPVVGFYYETGLRTVYSRIDPGGRVRDDPREQAMPFLMLIIVVEGVAEGEVDGTRVTVSKGEAVFVPPNATHLWWNDTDEPAAAVIVMFGEGA